MVTLFENERYRNRRDWELKRQQSNVFFMPYSLTHCLLIFFVCSNVYGPFFRMENYYTLKIKANRLSHLYIYIYRFRNTTRENVQWNIRKPLFINYSIIFTDLRKIFLQKFNVHIEISNKFRVEQLQRSLIILIAYTLPSVSHLKLLPFILCVFFFTSKKNLYSRNTLVILYRNLLKIRWFWYWKMIVYSVCTRLFTCFSLFLRFFFLLTTSDSLNSLYGGFGKCSTTFSDHFPQKLVLNSPTTKM